MSAPTSLVSCTAAERGTTSQPTTSSATPAFMMLSSSQLASCGH